MRAHVFVLGAEGGLAALYPTLRTLFTHRWVETYQIGFGPPLVRSSDRLIQRLRDVKSALEKLEVYVDVCLASEEERSRLAGAHRRLTVRRLGPVDAELVDSAATEVLDLELRLYHPLRAPPAVAAELRTGEVQELVPLHTAPDAMAARFHVSLHDPRGERLLFAPEVRAALPQATLAVPLHAPATFAGYYRRWLARVEADSRLRVVDLGEPLPHARTLTNGDAR